MAAVVPIEPHARKVVPWRQAHRGGSIEDRKLREVTVSDPPTLSAITPLIPSSLGAAMDEALREITALDESHGAHLASLSALLLRAESVASSKIEHIEASVDDYARALHGVRSNSSATSMVASATALDDLIGSVAGGADVTLAAVLRAHKILMADDPDEHRHAGLLRDMQNWIGGSDYSPRGADYVPPPPADVSRLMDDLMGFCNRDDLNVMTQAAIAHAQFESIHPFTDGNGRIGRAVINTILRRRGTTRRIVVPLASAIVADRRGYFDALDAYRDGDVGPLLSSFAAGSAIAAAEAQVSAARIAELPAEWHEVTGRPRRGSAASKLLASLLDEPIFSADDAEGRIGGVTSSVYTAIARLADAGVIRPLTDRKRNQIWVAGALADELEDLGVRIDSRARGR